jgi:hypothetical protein
VSSFNDLLEDTQSRAERFWKKVRTLYSYLQYTIRNPEPGIKNLIYWSKRYVHHCGWQANRLYYRSKNPPDGYNLMTSDWDTAIILDACRYDFFNRQHSFENGVLRREKAPGSNSSEFMERSFNDDQYHDTVYVTGNPFAADLEENTFHAVIFDELSDSGNIIPEPDAVTAAALTAHEEYPNKRIIVHYMQPHVPICHPDYDHVNKKLHNWGRSYWPKYTSTAELRKAYAANLDYVLEHVENLISGIEGQIVITADHGELLGERLHPIPIKGYDHDSELYVEPLIAVPWFTMTRGPRRTIRSDSPKQYSSIDEELVENRLKSFGYK